MINVGRATNSRCEQQVKPGAFSQTCNRFYQCRSLWCKSPISSEKHTANLTRLGAADSTRILVGIFTNRLERWTDQLLVFSSWSLGMLTCSVFLDLKLLEWTSALRDSFMFWLTDHNQTEAAVNTHPSLHNKLHVCVAQLNISIKEVENLLEPLGVFKQKGQNILRQNKFSLSFAAEPFYSTFSPFLVLNAVKSCSSVYHSSRRSHRYLYSNCHWSKSLLSNQFDFVTR